jgi:hypothetical protein
MSTEQKTFVDFLDEIEWTYERDEERVRFILFNNEIEFSFGEDRIEATSRWPRHRSGTANSQWKEFESGNHCIEWLETFL